MKTRKLVIKKQRENKNRTYLYEDTIIQTPSYPKDINELKTTIGKKYGSGNYSIFIAQKKQVGMRLLWHGNIDYRPGDYSSKTITYNEKRFNINWRD